MSLFLCVLINANLKQQEAGQVTGVGHFLSLESSYFTQLHQ